MSTNVANLLYLITIVTFILALRYLSNPAHARRIPILDDLGRALEAAAEREEVKLEEGVRLVHRSLSELLTKQGLSEIETDGKFDPHVHEALLSQPSDQEEGSVIEVVQKGYKLGDKVLRPARVVVAASSET